MADDQQSPLSGLWTEPLRRDARTEGAPLPSAAPIGHAADKPPAVNRGRLIAGFAAVLVIGVSATTASVLTAGTGLAGYAFTAEAGALDHTAAALSGERGGLRDTGRAGADQTDASAQTDAGAQTDAETGGSETSLPASDVDARTGRGADAGTADPGTGTAPESDAADPVVSAPSDPGTVNPPGASAPPAQQPSEPAPAPSAPPPAPVPAPDPPTTAPQPVATKPLAFTGLTENRATVLGIPLLSSYTLSLSGEPGSTASVTYGSLPAGSVTFDGGGHASLKLGGSLLGIKLSNPVIRAAYSDGTAGASVEARRDSI